MFSLHIPKKISAILIYGRPPLVFCAMLCALGTMWNNSPTLYVSGVTLLFVSMVFDLVDGWFAVRFQPHPVLASLAERLMDKVVYSITFPLVAVGTMWRLLQQGEGYSRGDLLHAILVLLLCITVLVRDQFAHFIRRHSLQDEIGAESTEFTRLRTVVAAPVGLLLYTYVFYVPAGKVSYLHGLTEAFASIPVRWLFIVEIVFLIINFGSIAAHVRKFGGACLDELCLGDEELRRRILSFFPNALTVMNAMMGILAVFFAYQGRMRDGYLILIGAAVFDKLDGALARKLGLTDPGPASSAGSRFTLGGILDDIADGVSFCIVPALIFYISLSPLPTPFPGLSVGWVAFSYAFLGIARLVYFTLDRTPIPGYFKGMPTPAAALLVVAPLVLYCQAAMEQNGAFVAFWAKASFVIMLFVSLLMNLYPVHYLHFGRFMDRHPWFARFCLLSLFVSLFTPYFAHLALLYLVLYLLSPLVSWRYEPGRSAGS
ncbi:MAG: CDP-alcohol phosphatidyltransferase family protein [Pseudomonadota bacterium]